METRPLGRTGIEVGVIGLGTMTFGDRNTEAEAHRQLDLAVERGVTLVDTAEMYPSPPSSETQGRTEALVGSWLAKPGNRRRVVLAGKVLGRDRGGFPHIRGGRSRLDRTNVQAAVEASLQRLRTDCIDLYQLHWPDRRVPLFGAPRAPQPADADEVPPEETLAVLDDLVQAGKIRAVGLSNETAWGVHAFIGASERRDLPRIASIQNAYSLLNRTFEAGLAEMALREQVGLLAYSPLAMGLLTGKYAGGARPRGARLTVHGDRFPRYAQPLGAQAAERYAALARQHELVPAQLALAWACRRPFVTSVLVGATGEAQLAENIAAAGLRLDPEVLESVEAIHREVPNPCP